MAPYTFTLTYPTAAHDVPQLLPLIAQNCIHIHSDEVVGVASDGSEVTLGSLSSDRDRQELQYYLSNYPTPDKW